MSENTLKEEVWQDRQIKFDQPTHILAMRSGEIEIDSINAVEDTKGNNGHRGVLIVTNLRIIWQSSKNPRANLSIGLNCVTNVSTRVVNSKLKGNTQALHVMTRFSETRFEFIFTSLVKNSPRLFSTVQAVHRSYETTKLYRDLKLRGAIIKDKELVMLPNETLYESVNGIWNLSSDQGNLGTFFITNVRIVWFATLAENFNVSIPFVQMKSIVMRTSKFGQALVIETTASSGGYILGFRSDPVERLENICTTVTKLWNVFSQKPVFGVEVQTDKVDRKETAVRIQEDVQIVEMNEYNVEPSILYHADGEKETDREPVYSAELGLAVERPLGGTLAELFAVVA